MYRRQRPAAGRLRAAARRARVRRLGADGQAFVAPGDGARVGRRKAPKTVRSWPTSALVGLCILFAHEPAALAQHTPSLLFPLRSIHASGNWGTNELIVAWWEADRARPLVPADYIEWLKRLHVNLIGLSVEIAYQDSTDSTVERAPNSFSDDALRQFIREFRAHDIQVYLTLALTDYEAGMSSRPAPRWLLGDHQACCGALQEYWPWDPEHPDHERFVAEFWDTYARQAVHLARIAEAEGVRLYSLGTETDRLFRTRPGGGYFINDFGQELRSMVDRVRAVYSGLLTYDMHSGAARLRGRSREGRKYRHPGRAPDGAASRRPRFGSIPRLVDEPSRHPTAVASRRPEHADEVGAQRKGSVSLFVVLDATFVVVQYRASTYRRQRPAAGRLRAAAGRARVCRLGADSEAFVVPGDGARVGRRASPDARAVRTAPSRHKSCPFPAPHPLSRTS